MPHGVTPMAPCSACLGYGWMNQSQFNEAQKQLAALCERSEHSKANRYYITERLDALYELLNGTDGISARLIRVEEKLDHIEKRERRYYAWLAALVPILAVGVQYLLMGT